MATRLLWKHLACNKEHLLFQVRDEMGKHTFFSLFFVLLASESDLLTGDSPFLLWAAALTAFVARDVEVGSRQGCVT